MIIQAFHLHDTFHRQEFSWWCSQNYVSTYPVFGEAIFVIYNKEIIIKKKNWKCCNLWWNGSEFFRNKISCMLKDCNMVNSVCLRCCVAASIWVMHFILQPKWWGFFFFSFRREYTFSSSAHDFISSKYLMYTHPSMLHGFRCICSLYSWALL